MERVIECLTDCEVRYNPCIGARGEISNAGSFTLSANRHTVVQRIEAALQLRSTGGVGSRVAHMLDAVQAVVETEQLLYAMLTPAEMLAPADQSAVAASDFVLPVSLIRCLLEVPALQAGLMETLAELLVSIDKGTFPVQIPVNYTKLILNQFRFLPIAPGNADRAEGIMFEVVEAASPDAKKDVIALLPELFSSTTDSLCERLRSLLIATADADGGSGDCGSPNASLTPAIFDCLTLLPLAESQLEEFRSAALQLLAAARSQLSVPVLVKFLLDNPPPNSEAAATFLLAVRSRLDLLAPLPIVASARISAGGLQQPPRWATSTQHHGGDGGAGSSVSSHSGIASLNLSCIPSSAAFEFNDNPQQLKLQHANNETAETLVCELIQRKLAANPQLAALWLTAIESLQSRDNLYLVDLLVMSTAYALGRHASRLRQRRRSILRLVRSRVRLACLPPDCGAVLCRQHPTLARRMADQLLDLLDGLCSLQAGGAATSATAAAPSASSNARLAQWTSAIYAELFGCLGPHSQQALVASLLRQLGSGPDLALQCLACVAEAWPVQLASFAALLRAALDVLHQLTPGQARLLYSVLARLAYQGGRRALQDDLCILVRKQLWHSRPLYQSYGVLGALAMLQCIMPSDRQQPLPSQFAAGGGGSSESDDVKSAVSLVNLVRKACTQSPNVSLLFLDELAAMLEAGRLHVKVAAWLAEVAKKDFFDNYTAPAEEDTAAETRQPRLGLSDSALIAVAVDAVPSRRLPCLAAHLRLLAACVPASGIAGLALCPLMMPHPALCPPPVLLATANWCTQVANSFAGTSGSFESAVLDRLRRSVELRAEFVTALCGDGSGSGGGQRWEQPIPLAQLDGTAITHVTLRWQNQPAKSGGRRVAPQKNRRKRRADDIGDENDDDKDDVGGLSAAGFDANDSTAAAAAAVVSAFVDELGATLAVAPAAANAGGCGRINKLVDVRQLAPCYRQLTDRVFKLMTRWTDEQMGEPLILHLLEDLHQRAVTLLGDEPGGGGACIGRRKSMPPTGTLEVGGCCTGTEAIDSFLGTVSHLSPRLVQLLVKAAGPMMPAAGGCGDNDGGNTSKCNSSSKSPQNANDDADDANSILDSSDSGRIVQLTIGILSLAVGRMAADKSHLMLPTLAPLAKRCKPSLADSAPLATVARHAAECVGQLVPACPSLETALDALTLCRNAGAPNADLSVSSGDVLSRRWDVKKRDQLARLYCLHVEAASPDKRPSLIGRLLTNHIGPVARGINSPDCPSLTRANLPDAFAQLLGDLARHCQANCPSNAAAAVEGASAPSRRVSEASGDESGGDDASEQRLLMRAWPDSLAALQAGLEVLRSWPESVRLQAIAMRYGRAMVDAFMRHGLPLIGRQFRCRCEAAVHLLKQLQASTRQLQAVANTCKDQNDGPTAALVPSLRRTLEAFIYRVRGLVAKHNCAAAFMPGLLKLKNIRGEEMDEIRRPDEYDVSDEQPEDENEDDGGSDAAADDCGQEDSASSAA